MTEDRDFEMQVEGNTTDVLVMMQDEGYSLEQAMDTLYQSRTFHNLERPETGLFFQSPVYIHDLLCCELNKEQKQCS